MLYVVCLCGGTIKMQIDMTVGKPGKQILTFVKPIIVGNIFQQLYSMVDAVIVGRCLGVEALAAVGSTGNITGMMLGFLIGFTTGLTMYGTQKFGAKDWHGIKKSAGNGIVIALLVTLLGTAISIGFIDKILQWINTPSDIYELSRDYLLVMCCGFLFMVAYNMCASLLRSVGNSKTPLLFLVISSALNIVMDIVFIVVFHWGIIGAAAATVLSQGISVGLCIIYIIKYVPILHLTKESLRLDWKILSKQLSIGIPMALQYSITAMGCIILQSVLNMLGSTAIAAYTAAVKIECLVTQPYPALGVTMAAYTAQNKGNHDTKRICIGVKKGFQYCLIYSVTALVLVNMFLPYMLPMFISGKQIYHALSYAKTFTWIDSVCYLPLGCIFLFRETLQGSGHALFPMIGGIIEMVCRIVISMLALTHLNFELVCIANAGTWVITAVYIMIVYCIYVKKGKL